MPDQSEWCPTCFEINIFHFVWSHLGDFGGEPRPNSVPGGRKQSTIRLKSNDSKVSKSIQNPPKYPPGALQKRSWKKDGSKTIPTCPVLVFFGKLLAPLGRFRPAFGRKLGASGVQNQAFWHEDASNCQKMRHQKGCLKKQRFFMESLSENGRF